MFVTDARGGRSRICSLELFDKACHLWCIPHWMFFQLSMIFGQVIVSIIELSYNSLLLEHENLV
jgi:hypothetical protein